MTGLPTTWSIGHTSIAAVGLMADSDAQSSDCSITITLEHDYVGDGKSWVKGASGAWTGIVGGTAPNGSMPIPYLLESVSKSQKLPVQSRVVVNCGKSTDFGFNLTVK